MLKVNNTEGAIICAALAGLGMNDPDWMKNLKNILTDNMINEFKNMCESIDSIDDNEFNSELMKLFVKNLEGEIYVG